MNGIAAFLALVDAYRSKREVSDARVSTLVFNDGSRVGLIRSGNDIGTRRLVRAIQWFSDHWPDGASWPAGVTRPEPSDFSSDIPRPAPSEAQGAG